MVTKPHWPTWLRDPLPLYAEITPIRGRLDDYNLRLVRCVVRDGRSGRKHRLALWLWLYDCPDLIRADLNTVYGFRAERIRLL